MSTRGSTREQETGAETVVVATDGYPSGLLGELEGLIVPTRGQVIATEPIEERLFEVPHYGRHGFDYWHQAPDGRIVAGGFRDVSLETEFTADDVTTPAVQDALDRFIESHLGRPLRVDYRWAGIFGMVFDFVPVVGRVPGQDGLWIAGGYSGHGNVLGFACGRLVARAILGDRDPLLDLFEPGRLLAPGEASLTLQADCLEIELGCLRERDLRNSEILDREACRVEERDVTRASAAFRFAREHRSELGDVRPRHDARIDSGRELSAVAGLLPVVAEQVRAT